MNFSYRLPTDSMYKFMATFGILLIFIGVIVRLSNVFIEYKIVKLIAYNEYCTRRSESIVRELNKLKTSVNNLESSQSLMLTPITDLPPDSFETLVSSVGLDSVLAILPRLRSDSIERISQLDNTLERISNCIIQYEEIDSLLIIVNAMTNDFEELSARSCMYTVEVNELYDLYYRIEPIGNRLIAVGSIFTILGFFLWYTLLQKHIDKEIASRNKFKIRK